jgi:mannose-6-phosphate isomerase-like protein (cupin superfamily)
MDFKVEEMADLASRRARSGEDYLEFLKVPALNAGVYELAAGADDPQTPHDEDELYYVVSGRAVFRGPGEERPVRPGSVIYVRADVPHRFVKIEEDLRLLVFFSSWLKR